MGTRKKMKMNSRALRHDAEYAINRDLIAGIIELVLNSDDSYCRLEQKGENASGEIVVMIDRKRKGKSKIAVIDFAEGMETKKIEEILEYGGETSEFKDQSVRGFFGRGLKDAVVSLGESGTLTSIKDGILTVYKIYSDVTEIEDVYVGPATKEKLKEYGMENNARTKVEIVLKKDISVPHFNNLKEKIQNNYLLRNVVQNKKRRLTLQTYDKTKEERLFLKKLEGEVLFQKEGIRIKGEAKTFDITICLAKEPLTQQGPERMGGLLVISGNTVHDCSLFGYDNDPAASKLFGEVNCSHINALLKEEVLVVRPDRTGLNDKIPFVSNLKKSIKKELKPIVEELTKKETEYAKIDKETKKRFDEAIKKLNEIAKKELAALEEEGDGERSPQMPKNGLEFIPPFSSPRKIEIGEKGVLYLRILCPSIVPSYEDISFVTNNDNISLPRAIPISKATEISSGLYQLKINVEGEDEGETKITAITNDKDGNKREATATVIVIKGEEAPANGIEFGRDSYNIQIGKKTEMELLIDSALREDSEQFVIRYEPENGNIDDILIYQTPLIPLPAPKKNVIRVNVKVEGKLIGATGLLMASYNGRSCSTKIKVVGKKQKTSNVLFHELKFENSKQKDLKMRGYYSSTTKNITVFTNEKSVKQYISNPSKDMKKAEAKTLIAEIATQIFVEYLAKKRIKDGLSKYTSDDPIDAFNLERNELEAKYAHIIHKIIALG